MEDAAPLFENEIFIQAAKERFRAESVRPVAMMTNSNLPMAGLPPHLDLPFFRGAMNREVPAWMLVPMGYSGLFQEWAVPVASAVTWFYESEGGEFEYQITISSRSSPTPTVIGSAPRLAPLRLCVSVGWRFRRYRRTI